MTNYGRLMTLLAFAAASNITLGSTEAAPLQFRLQVRSNLTDGYLLPPLSSFTQSTTLLNDAGQIAVSLVAVAGASSSGLWVGQDGSGEVVHQTRDDGILLGPLSQSSDGRVLFSRILGNGIAEGLFLWDPATRSTRKILEAGLSTPHIALSGPTLFRDGAIGFRSSDFDDHRSLMTSKDGALRIVSREHAEDAASPYEFIFAPAMSENGHIAAKTTKTDGSTALALWGPGATLPFEIPLGELEGLDNSIAISPDGKVAFVGHVPGNHRGIFLWDGTRLKEIASTRSGRIGDVAWFAPAVNRHGIVAFRGKSADGLQAVFAGDGDSLVRIVAEHDVLPSDLGPARIDEHVDSHPVFAGGVSINSSGVVAFRATLTPPEDNQVEWGQGVYTVHVAFP